jgi:hypothetical protein
MKMCPVEAELFHADRRTGRHDETNSRFRNVSQASNNCQYMTPVYAM